jgi:YD repeat-containing protein
MGRRGNRTQRVDPTGTTTLTYDALHRLTGVTYPGPQSVSYTYDAVGNRLTQNSTSYTYGDADQMLTVTGTMHAVTRSPVAPTPSPGTTRTA